MKYYLFAFDTYYPSGGANDFQGLFDSLEAAKDEFPSCHNDNAHVAILQGGKLVVVAEINSDMYGGTGKWEVKE